MISWSKSSLRLVSLTDDEKIVACQIAKLAGADFVKTSTGFSTGGATVEDVALMRQTVGPDMGVKASGGARSMKMLLLLSKLVRPVLGLLLRSHHGRKGGSWRLLS